MKKITLLVAIALSIGIVSAQNQKVGNGHKTPPNTKTSIGFNKQKSHNSNFSKASYFSENFDGTFPPTGWTTQVLLATKTWKAGNPSATPFTTIDPTNVSSAICSYSAVGATQNEWLKTPSITNTATSSNLFLKFWAGFSFDYLPAGGGGNPGATLKCKISTDGGTIWTDLWDANNTPTFTGWVWREVSIDLNAYKSAPFMIAWQVSGADGDLMGLDNVSLADVSTNDCGVTAVNTPTTDCGLTNQEVVTVDVKNYGTASLSGIPVHYKYNNGTVVNETIPGPIAAGATLSYAFTAKVDASATGVVDSIIAYTSLTADGDLSNDIAPTYYFMNLLPKSVGYTNTFDTQLDLLGWSILDANADGSSWGIATGMGVGATDAAYYLYNSSNAGDDWLFSTCIDLAPGNYNLNFMERIYDVTYPERLEVKIGTSNDVAGMTSTIMASTALTDTVYQLYNNPFTIATAGTYYVGFHAISDANAYYFFIDNVNIAIVTSINENESVNHINVYPNPAKESFNVESTSNIESVKVFNLVGQVIINSAPDSKIYNVNTSEFVNGVYIVQVQTSTGMIYKKINISK